MADAQPLTGRTISPYRVIEKLGGGGMGVVLTAASPITSGYALQGDNAKARAAY